jgi:protein-S-isoprenylcysteine O-methyltransferase Ste14
VQRGPTAVSPLGRAFAVSGGVVFVLSLLYGVYRYVEFGSLEWRRQASSALDFWWPTTVNVALFTLFAIHHSVFARAGLKARVSALVSPALERAVYVWIASLLFIAILAAWRPVPGVVWSVPAAASLGLAALQAAGFVLTIGGAARLDVLDLAGVKQAFGIATTRAGLIDNGVYGLVRHPIYLGWVLLVWPAAVMNGSRLVFAATSTLYLLVAIPIEERELRRSLGHAYDDYARRVRWRIVPFVY